MIAPRKKLRVLLVEDSMMDARLLRELLRDADPALQPDLTHVQTLADALSVLKGGTYDCVLLDLGLPDGSGTSPVESVRAANRDIAIVVLTGLNDERSALEALRRGAQEYAVKGQYDGDGLLRVLHHAVERNYLLAEMDKQREREYLLASHDNLTGLPNRQLMLDRAQAALNQAVRQKEKLSLCFIDLDGFKPVNDTHGHAVGDALLKEVARILTDTVREGDTVARVGGDEFVVLLARVRDVEEAQVVAGRMTERIAAVTTLMDREIKIGASVGLAIYPDHGDSLDQLLHNADAAMYQAKRTRKQNPRAGTGAMSAPGTDLELALAESRLKILFQPWFDVERGTCDGTEVLVRLPVEQSEALTPAGFLWLAEKNNLLGPLGQWVLASACEQWRAWRSQGLDPGLLAINVTRAELSSKDFAESWFAILNRFGIAPAQLQLEVEEGVFEISRDGHILENLRLLRGRGARVIVDNFGRDVASMMNLVRQPIDGIKLDRSLLQGIRTGQAAAHALVSGILGFVKALELKAIIAGIETDEDRETCRQLGCRYLQGYALTPPLEADSLPALLQAPGRALQK